MIHLNAEYVMNKIFHALKSKIKKINKIDETNIEIVPITKTNMVYELKSLRKKVVNVIIGGINSISRALLSKEPNTNNFVIYAEGNGLRDVLKTQGVDTCRSFSNHIL